MPDSSPHPARRWLWVALLLAAVAGGGLACRSKVYPPVVMPPPGPTTADAMRYENYEDCVVAVVNGEAITRQDVVLRSRSGLLAQLRAPEASDAERAAMLQQLREQLARAADELVDEKVIYAEFKRHGWQVPPAVVESRLGDIIARETAGDRRKFERQLLGEHLSLAEFRETLERRIAIEMMLEEFVRHDVTVPPAKIDEFVRAHAEELSTIRLQLISVPANDPAKVAAVTKALAAREDFGAVARQHSADAATREQGGLLEPIPTLKMSPEIRKALKQVAVGEQAGPLPSGDQQVFIRVAELASPAEFRARARTKLWQEDYLRRYREYAQRLRQQAFIRLYR